VYILRDHHRKEGLTPIADNCSDKIKAPFFNPPAYLLSNINNNLLSNINNNIYNFSIKHLKPIFGIKLYNLNYLSSKGLRLSF